VNRIDVQVIGIGASLATFCMKTMIPLPALLNLH